MYLWLCWYANDEWGCYIVAPSRGKAKYLFQEYWDEGEFTDVRARKIKEAVGFREAVLDTDCPELEALGVYYLTEDVGKV